jgi:hypothetical protein
MLRLSRRSSIAWEYAFVVIRALAPAYKAILASMLQDRNLGDDSEVGILMIGSPTNGTEMAERETLWTGAKLFQLRCHS